MASLSINGTTNFHIKDFTQKKFEHQTKTLIQIRCFCLVEMERFAARSDSQYGALRADLLPTVSLTFRISRLKAIKNTDSRSVFLIGGEGEIRTLDKLSPMTVFKTVALNHSATSPRYSFPHLANIPPLGARCV